MEYSSHRSKHQPCLERGGYLVAGRGSRYSYGAPLSPCHTRQSIYNTRMIPEHFKTALEQRVADAVTNREAAIDVMKELQRYYGWLTDEAVIEASQLLGLSTLQIEELATFYEMIYRRPVGRHVVHVCDSISCWASGGETLLESLAHLLEIRPGSTTADGTVTLLPCSCLGNCGEAPCMMVDEVQHGRMTPENGAQVLAALRDNSRQ